MKKYNLVNFRYHIVNWFISYRCSPHKIQFCFRLRIQFAWYTHCCWIFRPTWSSFTGMDWLYVRWYYFYFETGFVNVSYRKNSARLKIGKFVERLGHTQVNFRALYLSCLNLDQSEFHQKCKWSFASKHIYFHTSRIWNAQLSQNESLARNLPIFKSL